MLQTSSAAVGGGGRGTGKYLRSQPLYSITSKCFLKAAGVCILVVLKRRRIWSLFICLVNSFTHVVVSVKDVKGRVGLQGEARGCVAANTVT